MRDAECLIFTLKSFYQSLVIKRDSCCFFWHFRQDSFSGLCGRIIPFAAAHSLFGSLGYVFQTLEYVATSFSCVFQTLE